MSHHLKGAVRCQGLLAATVVIAGCHAGRQAPSRRAKSLAAATSLSGPGTQTSSRATLWRWWTSTAKPDLRRGTATLPVGAVGTLAHHTGTRCLRVVCFGRTGLLPAFSFQFDLRDPTRPRLTGSFAEQVRSATPQLCAAAGRKRPGHVPAPGR
jgi:hypothetical protein